MMFIPISGKAKHIQISKVLGVAEQNKQSAVLILSTLKTTVNFPVPEGLLHSLMMGVQSQYYFFSIGQTSICQ